MSLSGGLFKRLSVGPHIGLVFGLFLYAILPLISADVQAAWQSDFNVQVVSPKIQTIFFEGKLSVDGMQARIETAGSDETDLYHFKDLTEIRIFPGDGIYFKKPLSLAKQVKAAKEGWGPIPEAFHETKIFLQKGVFKDRAAALYLFILKRGEQSAYTLRWVSDDLAAHPLRAIYTSSGRETIIVDFDQKTETALPSDFFNPPAGFLSLNPF